MALTNSDVVAVRRIGTTGAYQGQPPMFGVVSVQPAGQGAPAEIVWYDGKMYSVVPDLCIDAILAPTSGTLFGEIVRVRKGSALLGHSESDEYVGIVAQVYKRDLNKSGQPSADLCLVKCIDSGLWFEAAAADCVVIEGR